MSRGQTSLEYIYVLGVFIAALIAMGVYMSRGFQGKYRELGEQTGPQYSPASTSSTVENWSTSDTISSTVSSVQKIYSDAGVSITNQTQTNNLHTDPLKPIKMHSETRDETSALENDD